MTNTKMCFNCFGDVSPLDPKCPNCGVELFAPDTIATDKKVPYSKGVYFEPDYEQEKIKLDKAKKGKENLYSERILENDIKIGAVLISLIGLLQIYTSGLIDSINGAATFLELNTIVDGKYFIYTGFLYFFGISLFFINYRIARLVYLIANLTQIYILYQYYGVLYKVYNFLNFIGRGSLPPEILTFFNNVGKLRIFIALFGILYVVHSIFLFRFELGKMVPIRGKYR